MAGTEMQVPRTKKTAALGSHRSLARVLDLAWLGSHNQAAVVGLRHWIQQLELEVSQQVAPNLYTEIAHSGTRKTRRVHRFTLPKHMQLGDMKLQAAFQATHESTLHCGDFLRENKGGLTDLICRYAKLVPMHPWRPPPKPMNVNFAALSSLRGAMNRL